jgi:uncharacterized protein YcgI (DUF1989 family)
MQQIVRSMRQEETMSGAFDEMLSPGGGKAFPIEKGQRLVIYQVDGVQVADLLSFNLVDPAERLSMWMSCCVNWVWKLTAPHILVSNRGRDMWAIEEDTVGENYSGGGYCCDALNERWFGSTEMGSCEATFQQSLGPFGIAEFEGDNCLNVFMAVEYTDTNEWRIRECPAGPTDYIVLRAKMDQVVAISNCPVDNDPTNGYRAKPLGVRVS